MPDDTLPVLDVQGLKTVFKTRGGEVHAVNDVTFSLRKGELLGVVGESGSGKSVTMMSLLGLLPVPPAEIRAGSVMFEGQDLLTLDPKGLRRVRGGRIGFVFQDPMTSLNPVFTVGHQIAEPLRKHMGMSKKQAAARSKELLELVGIPDADQRLLDYPHQFSGGMRQRVMIAIALACDPQVLIADEPTTALDVTIQAQILDLLADLRAETGMGLVLITHDMGVVAETAERVSVQYAGQKIEEQPVGPLFDRPHHPYTAALLDALPERATDKLLPTIPGVVPGQFDRPSGCLFSPRCRFANDKCRTTPPPTAGTALGDVRCHYPLNADERVAS